MLGNPVNLDWRPVSTTLRLWCMLVLLFAGTAGPALAAEDVSIDSGPLQGEPTGNRSPTFGFSVRVPVAGFECRIDDAPAMSCASPFTTDALEDGRHVFEVVALDSGGVRGTPVRRSFRIDTQPPDTRILASPRGRVETIDRRAKAIFRFRGARGHRRFECRLDRRLWRPCYSPTRLFVGPGRHVLSVRAIDAAGNLDNDPAMRSWRVRRWQPGVRSARRYASRRVGHVSFAVDLGWRVLEFHRGHRARSASTLKAVLMVAYLRQRDVRDRSLASGEKSLLGAMIRHSDNAAATTVRNVVGARAIKRLARRSGMADFGYSPSWGTCLVSAGDYARFMRRLPSLVPGRHRGFALYELRRISDSQRWGVGRLDLRGWSLHFKGGWGISDGRYGGVVNHQIALLRSGRRRIGVAILTEGNPTVDYGSKTLHGIAARLLRSLPD